MSEFHIDSSEYASLGKAIAALPAEIRAKAMRRAMNRMKEMARTRIVRMTSQRVDLPPNVVRDVTTARLVGGTDGEATEIVMSSEWIPLMDLEPIQIPEGVAVKLRGSYKSAFIAKMKSGHMMVAKRGKGERSPRLPVRELFGPNPAHDVTGHEDVYADILAKLIEERLAARVLHEIDRLLPK